VFSEFGAPIIPSRLIPYEDELWDAVELPWHVIASMAAAEAQKARAAGLRINQWDVTDKDYLTNDKQKIESGMYWHFTPDVSSSIVLRLVGDAVKTQLTFSGQTMTNLPLPPKVKQAFVQSNRSDDYEEPTIEV
jgi:hypothetical protein